MADATNVISSIFKIADTGLNTASGIVSQKNLENELYDARTGQWVKTGVPSTYSAQSGSISNKNLNTTLIYASCGVAVLFILSKVIKRKKSK